MLCGIIISSYRGCGWFFPQKQISNFLKFLLKFLLKKSAPISKRIVLAILLAALFLPSFVLVHVKVVNAEVISGQQTSLKTLTDESVTGSCPTDKMPFTYNFEVSKTPVSDRTFAVGINDLIQLNIQILPIAVRAEEEPFLNTVIANCQRMARDSKLQFNLEIQDLKIRPRDGTTTTTRIGDVRVQKAIVTSTGMIGVTFPKFSIGSSASSYIDQTIYGEMSISWEQNAHPAVISSFRINLKAENTGGDIQIPDLGSGGGGTTDESTRKLSDLQLQIKPDSSGRGLKDLYRTWVGDTQVMAFGENGLDAINVTCVSEATCVRKNQLVELPEKNDTWFPDGTATYKYFKGSFNLTKNVQTKQLLCDSGGLFNNDVCKNSYFGEGDLVNQGAMSGEAETLGTPLNPKIYPVVWANAKGGDVIELSFIPRMTLLNGINKYFHVVFNQTSAKTKLEVYATKEEVKQKCLSEHASDPKFCDNENNIRYQVGKNVIGTAGTTEKGAGSTIDQLFEFIRKVIAYIVLLLTSFIYYIFSKILVPVIVALIGIHPYKDTFVNFIYPGWVIIRNISNIFFIIALLWVGLRTLFQLDDASKSRPFIIRLILMALLVNFSLVIGQSIVGIADTFQSQFLPKGTKVVETLGFKLMVDPIQTFRGVQGANPDDFKLTENSNFTTTALASDLPKAIILLILAVAAFFAFVALIAFMVVRLAALWILYMLSPLAFVGRILPQTEKYADQWWTEFIRYAFAVPVMAFFLNITALMAVTMAKTSGNSVTTGNSNTPLLGGLINAGDVGAGVVGFAMTVISHFIILAFLFIGMKFAMSFGGFGAQKIVDAAKKGFDAVTRKAPKALGVWAKDTGSDALANSRLAQNRPNLQTAIRAAARPVEAIKAAKKGYFDEPKKIMNKRFTDKFDELSNKLQPWGENKTLPAWMLAYKLAGKDTASLLDKAGVLREKASILDNSERDELKDKLTGVETDKDRVAEIKGRLGEGKLGLYGAQNELARLEKLHEETEQQVLATAGKDPTKNFEYRKQADDLKERKEALSAAIVAAQTAGATEINIADVKNGQGGLAFNQHDLEEALQKQIDEADELIAEIKPKLDTDQELRSKFGVTEMNPKLREAINKEVDELTKKAQARDWPHSKAVEKAEAEKVKEHQKDLVDLDYEQLEDVYTSALKKNNLIQARAAVKQMAENGQISKLLKAKGLKNNVEDLQTLVKDAFKGSNRTQVNIIREISNISAKNGNNSLAYAVTSTAGGGGMLNSLAIQQEKIAEGKHKSIFESKGDDLIYEDKDGKHFNKGAFEKVIKPNDTGPKLNEIKKKLDPRLASNIWEVIDSQPDLKAKLSKDYLKAIDEVRLK